MRNKNFLIIVFFISIVFLIQLVFAITANSSNYSVGRFGTGLATSNASSTNYETLFLLESQGTTRNAESDSYTSNIGFFNDTPYYRAVSITSYSVYPESAVRGSIIRLSVSALNSKSVWAILTLPNSTQQTISMTNNVYSYYTASVVGVYTVTFYANNSQNNLASVIETFEITSPVSSTSLSRRGTTTIIEKCTYIWDCSSWSICSNGTQKRECNNIGNCTGTEGKPIEKRECSDALFDVVMKFKGVELTQNETLNFSIELTETKGIEEIDVQIRYSIIDSNKTEIFSQIETRAVQGNLTFEKEITEIKLKEGKYKLRVDILYGNLQRAFAEQNFEVTGEEANAEIPEKNRIKFLKINYKIFIMIGILFIIFLFIYFFAEFFYEIYDNIRSKFQNSKMFARKLGARKSIH